MPRPIGVPTSQVGLRRLERSGTGQLQRYNLPDVKGATRSAWGDGPPQRQTEVSRQRAARENSGCEGGSHEWNRRGDREVLRTIRPESCPRRVRTGGYRARSTRSLPLPGLSPTRSVRTQIDPLPAFRGQAPAVARTSDRAAAVHAVGHAFYQAANGVWLTDHVPPGCLSGWPARAASRRTRPFHARG
jgi:hypothetical protein